MLHKNMERILTLKSFLLISLLERWSRSTSVPARAVCQNSLGVGECVDPDCGLHKSRRSKEKRARRRGLKVGLEGLDRDTRLSRQVSHGTWFLDKFLTGHD